MSFLILKTGTTLGPIREQRGDFEDWFAAGLGQPVHTVDVQQRKPPHPQQFSGVVITGSAAMVSHAEPWMVSLYPWLRAAPEHAPVLGVCFGHQLLAAAYGAEVGPNPRGRAVGSARVVLNRRAQSDPLTAGMPEVFTAQVSHAEAVLDTPSGAVVLGQATHDPNHILRFAPRCWGVQFHPEFDAQISRDYILHRADLLREEGIDVARAAERVEATPQARSVLAHFAALCQRAPG